MTMKTYTQKELNRILDNHKLWLYSQGKEGIKANFRGADLQEVDLQGVDLQGAFLKGAHLRGADLRGAYLRGADLQGVEFDDIIMIIDTTYYTIQIKGKKWIKVGCQEHSLEQWLNFKEKEIKKMADDALEFYPILVKCLKTLFNFD